MDNEVVENKQFMPMSHGEMAVRGWDELDFLIVSGDAYVDHPSFAAAVIGRWLEKNGFRVGIVAQPDWRKSKDFAVFGRPRLAVLVSAGNLDSMLANYTSARRLRKVDNYAPGGKTGLRPDRATLVYCNRVRELWGNIPLIIGGIEASLRRFAHYDYWDDKVRRSLLLDSRADLLVYGMGEQAIGQIAGRLAAGGRLNELRDIAGTCYVAKSLNHLAEKESTVREIPAYDVVRDDKPAFVEAWQAMESEQNPFNGKILVQRHGDRFLIQNPPTRPLSVKQMDEVYGLPWQRTWHPRYDEAGGVPANSEVKFSIISQRGCFGGCAFCALHFHQGRIIQARSEQSIVDEAQKITAYPDFKGYIHDVGGPTANFHHPACKEQLKRGACKYRQCLFPQPCPGLDTDHGKYMKVLRRLRAMPGIKKVFVRSGLRYDYLLLAQDAAKLVKELCQHHISGQLKIAPEHCHPKVLKYMGKPGIKIFQKFMELYKQANLQAGKEQYAVPYLMSGHPGCGLTEAVALAEFVRDMGYHPEQVQDFIPTPGSLATCMFFTGINPLTGEAVYVPRRQREKAWQRALIQFRNPKNYDLVYEALKAAGREDLIGHGDKCLIRPRGINAKTIGAERCRRENKSIAAKQRRKGVAGSAKKK